MMGVLNAKRLPSFPDRGLMTPPRLKTGSATFGQRGTRTLAALCALAPLLVLGCGRTTLHSAASSSGPGGSDDAGGVTGKTTGSAGSGGGNVAGAVGAGGGVATGGTGTGGNTASGGSANGGTNGGSARAGGSEGDGIPGSESIVGQWHLDGNAVDSSGNGHNGVVTGATPTSGKKGLAYHFDGNMHELGEASAAAGQDSHSREVRVSLARCPTQRALCPSTGRLAWRNREVRVTK